MPVHRSHLEVPLAVLTGRERDDVIDALLASVRTVVERLGAESRIDEPTDVSAADATLPELGLPADQPTPL
jgi:hypothetical protein